MKLKCLIVDDEPVARKLLQEYIEEIEFLELAGIAENPMKAVGRIHDLDIDLMFLDINMPKMSGLDFLRALPSPPMTILTTAYGQFALDGFELAVIDYLVKPFSPERFLTAVQKALEIKLLRDNKMRALKTDDDHFYIRCDGKIHKIRYDELLYVEGLSNYVIVYTQDGGRVVYLTMKAILEKLPPAKFKQVHKSYIVNTDKVTAIEGNILHLGNIPITMGQHYSEDVIKCILRDNFLKR